MAGKGKSGWISVVVLLLLVGAGVFGWRYYKKRSDADAPPEYRTAPVARGDIVQKVTANGQLSPVKSVQVGSQVSGILTEVRVDFNSRVKAGDILAIIDPATFQQNLGQAEAELLNAKAQLQLAEINHRRTQELRKNELVSASEAENMLAQLHQAEAVFKMREASVRRSKVDLERTTIYSPIDGVVISRNVDVGQTVAASFNTPTLFLIANDLAKMQIEAMVSEADVGGVDVGQTVNFEVDAFPGRNFRGEVKQVRYAPTTNQNVVTYTTVVEVANPDLKLRPGMTAVANIVTGQKRDVLKIQNSAFRFRPPEGALGGASTNRPGAGPGGSSPARQTDTGPQGNSETRGAFASTGGGEGGQPNREEMRRRFESMSPEEREAFRARMGRGGSGGGPRGGGGRGGEPGQDGMTTRTVYVLAKGESTDGTSGDQLKPVTVKTGLSDGNSTEIIEGLKEGDVVVVGLKSTAPAAAAVPQGTSPFGNPMGRGMGRR